MEMEHFDHQTKQIQHPFHPPHPLILNTRKKGLRCNACRKWPLDFTFRCEECDFDLDGECALLVPDIKCEGHKHLLNFFDKIYSDIRLCDYCGSPCSASVLRCVECNFNVHKSCAHKFPKPIQHPFHPPHPLIFNNRASGLRCNACRKSRLDFTFRCDECDFDLDGECARLVPDIKCEGHKHLLNFFDKIYSDIRLCDYCGRRCSALVLRCVECNFNVHKACADKLPKQIQHPFHPLHPSHPLTLTLFDNSNSPDSGKCICGACLKPCDGVAFHCAEPSCEFKLDIRCAFRWPKLRYEIRHPFHPLHPLTFGYSRCYTCQACKDCDDGFTFRCAMCNFVLDHKCASVVPTIKYEDHEHSLSLFPKIYHNPLCKFCGSSCDAMVLRCMECDFNIHIQCHPSFPRSIKHKSHIDPLTFTTSVAHIDPFTLTDSLVEQDYDLDEFYCNVCEEKREPKHPVFYCADCPFVTHINCVLSEVIAALGESSREIDQLTKSTNEYASPEPTIKFGGHKHPLTFFEKLYQEQLCNSCNISCDACVLRCVECNFNLHISCHPLIPQTIKSICHIDPLTLVKSVEEDDDCDEFYCDACEQERNPEHAVYYCAECNYVVHIQCVISEVLPSLIAELESSARADKKEEYVTAINEEIRMLHMEMKEQKEKIEAEERKLEELAEKLKARERVRLQLLRGTMPSLQN